MATGAGVYYPTDPVSIRDATALRLLEVPGLTNVFNARKLPTKDAQTPYAGVWHAGDRTESIGDPNVGSPSFMHTLTLAIDVVASAGTQDGVEADIVALAESIKATLLTDTTWVELFEGIEKVDVQYDYPKEAGLLMVQAKIEIEVTFRSEWPPYAPNQFAEVDVTASTFPNPGSSTVPSQLLTSFEIETT